jgi:hypothetical protein
MDMRKKDQKSFLNASEKRIIQICLDNRGKIFQGLKLLKSIIHESCSKSAIIISSFLARKIRLLNR